MGFVINTLKDFLKLRGIGVDVCDDTIECPYCYMELMENIKDDYDKFVDYIESNVEFVHYNPTSCVGQIVGVKYLELLKKDIKVWIEFTNEYSREEFTISNFDNEDDFIQDGLCYVLESMLNGGYSEQAYEYFNNLIAKQQELGA